MSKIETIKIGEVSYELSDKELAAVKTTIGAEAVDAVAEVLYTADDEEVKAGTKAVGDVKTAAVEEVKASGILGDVQTLKGYTEDGTIIIPVEISKKGKVTVGGTDASDKVKNDTTADGVKSIISEVSSIKFVVVKNNANSGDTSDSKNIANEAVATAYPVNTTIAEVNILDLANRVAALEAATTTSSTEA